MKRKDAGLLMIHYYFPPAHTVAGVRLANFYREALGYFGSVHVLASRNRRFFPQDSSLETGCPNITALPAYDLRWLAHWKSSKPALLSAAARRRPSVQFLQRLLNSFPFNLLIGDGGAYYIYRGYRAGCRLVREESITHLFSSYRPYADHFIAYLLKRRFPQLVWIADFRDLQYDPALRQVFWPRFQRWCNRWVLQRADVVSTVSEGLKEALEQVHSRGIVLRNGIGQYERAEQPPFPRFTIAYTGSLYPEVQSAAPLFRTLQRLMTEGRIQASHIRLRYAGKDRAVWENWMTRYGLQAISEADDLLPLRQARAIQQRAHLNLLLSWSQPGSRGILTGKLYEYLAAGRPILCLLNASAPDPDWEGVFRPLPHCLLHLTGDHPNDVQSFLLRYYRAWKSGELPPRLPAAAPFTWAAQMEGFVGELEGVGWF